MDFVALDLEIADRRNEAPCSLALVLVQDGKITKEKQILIDPETEFNPFAIRVHGITPRQVAGCPTFPDIWPQLSAIFQKYPVVAHNAAFDISVAIADDIPLENLLTVLVFQSGILAYGFGVNTKPIRVEVSAVGFGIAGVYSAGFISFTVVQTAIETLDPHIIVASFSSEYDLTHCYRLHPSSRHSWGNNCGIHSRSICRNMDSKALPFRNDHRP